MKKLLLSVAVVVGIGLVAFPGAQGQSRIFISGTPAELAIAQSMGLERLRTTAALRGIADELVVSQVRVDELSMAHTRVQQRVRGVPVFGGEAIAHFRSNGELFTITDDLVPNIIIDTTPAITRDAAIDMALSEYGCRACLTAAPSGDLWILRHEGMDHLVYRVQLRRIDGTAATALPVFFVDAHGGYVVLAYDNLQTGTGSSLYSGNISIGTSFNAGTGQYYLENLVRRVGTFDLRNLTSTGTVFRFVDPDDLWNGSTQRAAVDAHFGAERYLDYLLSVHGRNGINGIGGPFWASAHDGSGGLISAIVHYGSNYNNAFWDSSGVMVYGDGDGENFSPLVAVDIAGHEMTHGVTQYTAGLIYQGESGALNESWSDVMGAMLERNVKGASTNTWKLAEEAYTPNLAGDALRYMDNPHQATEKGFTPDDDPDHYSERYTGTADNGGVHINSGVSNKAFYLLAQGGTHHRGGSMTGIGADQAARIWFVALTSYMTSTTNFASARTATQNAAGALYGAGSPQQLAVASAWCLVGVGTCGVPTADSVSPNSGSGASQTFALQYSDSSGATNLATTWVWFSATFAASSANSCMLYYDRPAGQLNLLNDASTVWTPGSLGAAAVLQNSQCSVNLAASSVSLSGDALTLNLAMTFKSAFGGAKNVYMYATNASGSNSGWQDRGDWNVPGITALVTADSVAPNVGSGASQLFALQYSDTLGATDLSTVWVWFNATFSNNSSNSCMLYYNRAAAQINMLNDAGTTWMPGTLGSATTLQNNQCSINLGGSSVVLNGNTLTLNLAVTFKPAYAGGKNVYMYATNGTINSGWQDRGDWTVPGAGIAVTADSITPNVGSGATQLFALQYSDTLGATDLSTVWVWFNATFSNNSTNSCMLYYNRPAGQLNMLNDAGTTWMAGTLGSGAVLQNSQCAVALTSSSVSLSGNMLTLNLNMTFKPAYGGAKNLYMYAASGGGINSGWQDLGDWTVPSAAPAVTADSATPNSGSGQSQTFALQYSDSWGATDLSTVWVWFNATFASTSADSCMVYFDRATLTLNLINDTGTGWIPGTIGSGGVLQNSQCSVSLSGSSYTPSGTTLTLNLAMTFQSTYAGAKNVYMYGAGTSANSGWQDRGDWTVTP
jgi:Zn-dependent metalloprotease